MAPPTATSPPASAKITPMPVPGSGAFYQLAAAVEDAWRCKLVGQNMRCSQRSCRNCRDQEGIHCQPARWPAGYEIRERDRYDHENSEHQNGDAEPASPRGADADENPCRPVVLSAERSASLPNALILPAFDVQGKKTLRIAMAAPAKCNRHEEAFFSGNRSELFGSDFCRRALLSGAFSRGDENFRECDG